jgi:hypothetical protein
MRADFSSGEKAERNTGIKPMRSRVAGKEVIVEDKTQGRNEMRHSLMWPKWMSQVRRR